MVCLKADNSPSRKVDNSALLIVCSSLSGIFNWSGVLVCSFWVLIYLISSSSCLLSFFWLVSCGSCRVYTRVSLLLRPLLFSSESLIFSFFATSCWARFIISCFFFNYSALFYRLTPHSSLFLRRGIRVSSLDTDLAFLKREEEDRLILQVVVLLRSALDWVGSGWVWREEWEGKSCLERGWMAECDFILLNILFTAQ